MLRALGNIEATLLLLQAAERVVADERFTSGTHKGLTLLGAATKYIKSIEPISFNKRRVSNIYQLLKDAAWINQILKILGIAYILYLA